MRNLNKMLDADIVNTIDGIYARMAPVELEGVTVLTEIPTKYHLLHMLRDLKVSIELITTSNGPSIVFWGLDATTPPEMQKTE